MLSETELKRVWESKFAAEARAQFCSREATCGARIDRYIDALSSIAFGVMGAFWMALSRKHPELARVIIPLALLVLTLKFWRMVTRPPRPAIDYAELVKRWNQIAREYTEIIENAGTLNLSAVHLIDCRAADLVKSEWAENRRKVLDSQLRARHVN